MEEWYWAKKAELERISRIQKKSTRQYSSKQEKAIAKTLNGKQVPNSGATKFKKGDVELPNFLIEAKTKTQPAKSMTIWKEWLIKNREEAFAMGKPYSALCFDFGDGERYYVVDEKLFQRVVAMIDFIIIKKGW